MQSINYKLKIFDIKAEKFTLFTRLGMNFIHVLFILLCVASTAAFAKPEVQGIDLIKKTTVSGNIEEDTYVLRINVDPSSYTNSAFTVTTKTPDIQIIQNKVQLGNIDAGSFILTTNSFSIRRNVTKQFSDADLVFTFEGEVTGIASGTRDENTPQIGPITFLELSGRPGHEGYYPSKSASPPAGKKVFLRVTIFGKPAGQKYQLIGNNQKVLSEGPLFNEGDENDKSLNYEAEVTIPDEPYRIKIVVKNPDNSELTQTSFKTFAKFTPATYAVNFRTSNASLRRGKYGGIKMTISNNDHKGDLIVELMLPDGFTFYTPRGRTDLNGSRFTKSYTLHINQVKYLRLFFKVNEKLESFTKHTVTVVTYFSDQPEIKQTFTQEFEVD